MGYLENARLPRGVTFYSLDGPFIPKVARANGKPSGRLARWAMELGQWDLTIKY